MTFANRTMTTSRRRPKPAPAPPPIQVLAERASAVLTIRNDKGLHTRPATELVRCANRFESLIHLTFHGATVNANSLLGILMLAAGRGSKITVEADGPDASEAIDALLQLAENRFYTQF